MELQDLFQNPDMTGILISIVIYPLSCRKDQSNTEVAQLEMVWGILEWIKTDHDT